VIRLNGEFMINIKCVYCPKSFEWEEKIGWVGATKGEPRASSFVAICPFCTTANKVYLKEVIGGGFSNPKWPMDRRRDD